MLIKKIHIEIESICIIDWAGNYEQPGYWADYFPSKNKVIFGGAWYMIPDMIISQQPSQKQCEEHIEKHQHKDTN